MFFSMKKQEKSLIKRMQRRVSSTITTISPVISSKLLYRFTFKRSLNLDNPITLNEKVLWLKLNTYKENPLITQCADKYEVRNYIKNVGAEETLNDLIAVWDKVEDIEWEKLPNKFVIKVNHGSGYNIICENKDKLNIKVEEKKLQDWLNEDYWKIYGEINYKFIQKKIICEKFIETEKGNLPEDYKFYCFDGVAKYVMVCIGREFGSPKFFYFDQSWNMMPFTKEAIEADKNIEIDKPKGMDEMFKYAEKISKPFPFVRADFYLKNNKTIFGELTFTPGGGLDKLRLEHTDLILGNLVNLPR